MSKRIETRFEMLADQPNRLWDTRYMRPYDVPFYHGTSSIFLPGETIDADYDAIRDERSNHPLYWGENTGTQGGYAFATTNIDTAKDYARDKADYGGGIGFIYEVEPLNWDYHYDPWDSWLDKDRGDQGGSESFRSPSGWKVIRLIEVVPGNEKREFDPEFFPQEDLGLLKRLLRSQGWVDSAEITQQWPDWIYGTLSQ